MHQISEQCRAVIDRNVEQGTDLVMSFYQIRHIDITSFVPKASKLQTAVKLTASGANILQIL